MVVELISVGTELLLGNVLNTNAVFLAKECAKLGLFSFHQITVGDNFQRLYDAISEARDRTDIIIITGGLGPTSDDITKEVVAKVVNKELIEDNHSMELLMTYFTTKTGQAITQNNFKQTLKIEDSIVLDNSNGTAPGYIYEDDKCIIILLPGPPSEVVPMFNNSVLPYLKRFQKNIIYSNMVKMCGIGESIVETMIIDLIKNQTNPTIAPYAQKGEVHLRITASANSEEEARKIIKPTIKELKNRLNDYIYTVNEEDFMEKIIVDKMIENNSTLSIAESCTGGLLASRITSVSGSSKMFNEGFITYSNEAKIKHLGVLEDTIFKYGAVSRETAIAMAQGVKNKTNSDYSISITGNAGPSSLENKEVGLVFIACAFKDSFKVEEFRVKGDRKRVREYAATYALNLLRKELFKGV